MPSTESEWKEHFESLQTISLLELLAVGSTAHDAIIVEVLRARGISNEELSRRIALIQENQAQQEAKQREKEDEYEVREVINVLKITGLIAVILVVLLFGFYSHIFDSILKNNFRSAQYILLCLMTSSATMPLYIFKFFARGGEIYFLRIGDSTVFRTSIKETSLDIYRNYTLIITIVVIMLSLFFLDPITSVTLVLASIVFSFVLLQALENFTDSKSSTYICKNIFFVYRVGIAFAIVLSITFLVGGIA